MSNTASSRLTYPSDLTDDQWLHVEPLLPLEKFVGRHRATDLREVVSAINYRHHLKCPWRMLPHDFPPWGTVYGYFRRWNQNGTLATILNVLKQRPRLSSSATPPHALT